MTRLPAPLWLTAPTRYARLSRMQARVAALVMLVVLAFSLSALLTPAPPTVHHNKAARSDDRADIVLYESIVAGVRGGGNYYPVAAQAQRDGHYPLRPFVTMRLPTLAMVQATLPRLVSIALLYALALCTFCAWFFRLRPVFARTPPRIVALTLLAGGMMAFVQSELVAFHEIWAGMLIALSLAVWRPGRWIEAVALALCAVLIRETAALYLIVMGGLALVEGRRREALGWLVAILILAVAVALHAHAVAQVVTPRDPHSQGWAGMLGFGFFVRTMTISTSLMLAPLWLSAPLVALALFGWSAWNDPTGLRAIALFAVYALLISLFGRVDTFYWGLLVAPVFLVGLAFVPDAVRETVHRLVDRRRITVTRRVQ
jgi:hypothetical protein